MKYLVTWEIDIDTDANEPSEKDTLRAANLAYEAMRREGSIANAFLVSRNVDKEIFMVDLMDNSVNLI